MQSPPLDPNVADLAPSEPVLTAYDEQHMVTYLRLFDADGADWREVARIVLHIDPIREPDRARRAFDSHLARAKWMLRLQVRPFNIINCCIRGETCRNESKLLTPSYHKFGGSCFRVERCSEGRNLVVRYPCRREDV